MATLNVTDLSEETMSALTMIAYSDRLAYVRSVLNTLANEPITRERFAYRVYGQAGRGTIKRHGNHPNETSGTFINFNQEEADVFKRAEDLIRRNQSGDLIKALGMLNDRFEEVVEIPV
jgi:hypothetical protein